jgi:hypothetical protein
LAFETSAAVIALESASLAQHFSVCAFFVKEAVLASWALVVIVNKTNAARISIFSLFYFLSNYQNQIYKIIKLLFF